MYEFIIQYIQIYGVQLYQHFILHLDLGGVRTQSASLRKYK